jgi:hypothetical protein
MNSQIFDLTDAVAADRLLKAEHHHRTEKQLAERQTQSFIPF